MIIERPSSARGRVQAGWLDSHHTFSFGQYYDPAWMGFGPLRVINEDRVDPGAGFPTHGHANMEILSYVLDGALAHKDSSGGGGVIRPGELQWMSAGHGVQHSEFNASGAAPVHFLQIWIQPDRLNAQPAYAQRAAVGADADGRWLLLAAPDGADGSIAIRQDARLYVTRLAAGARLGRTLEPQRRYWLQVTRGAVDVAGRTLVAGDALGLVEEADLQLHASQAAEVLLFDLP
ncbi:pirin family protein [Lysobacter solisilvae (ex Woo and Kim 2020)]|uniref:Pirin family protein n=1 Tax=Agrilutibacter terrestris TaxID=2865112 RepID=A0A7H0FZU0_9GAMM|nr:pirin family protein [Lysobacter terrestris]QNP41556.1 pirin family protein [Lysobacter terrestris]